jgi:hypothetical protein
MGVRDGIVGHCEHGNDQIIVLGRVEFDETVQVGVGEKAGRIQIKIKRCIQAGRRIVRCVS